MREFGPLDLLKSQTKSVVRPNLNPNPNLKLNRNLDPSPAGAANNANEPADHEQLLASRWAHRAP